MLQEEKHTQNAVAFKVDISEMNIANQETVPEIKKKLESYTKAASEPTLESIQEKLKKAEEKRRIALAVISPKVEERRRAALEKKINQAKENELHKSKVERDLMDANEKRRMTREERMKKVRAHIEKVEVIREQQQVKRR